jgi:hypothetical protein
MEMIIGTSTRKLPSCYLPQQLLIYKIPINDYSEFVYMKPNPKYLESHVPVIIATEPFLQVWKDTPKIDCPPFSVGIPYEKILGIWRLDRRLQEAHAEKGFSYGIHNPVPLSVIESIYKNGIYLTDGITRLLYLFVHKVKAFPIMCPQNHSDKLTELAGLNI